MNVLPVSYSTWKQSQGVMPTYYEAQDNGYVLYGVCPSYMTKASITQEADITDFEASYKAGCAGAVDSQNDAYVLGMLRKDVPPYDAKEPDGRGVFVNFPADEGSYLWLCGAGDDVENGVRGGGQRISFEFTDTTRPETKTLDVKFMEQVQLHDGQMTVTSPSQWDITDVWNWGIHMGATAVVENVTQTGNCNVVNPQGEPGQPDSYIIVPAAGDGAYDVDLATATPVPAGGQGFWTYDPFTNVLEASANPGGASYHLLIVDVDAYFMRNVTVPCHPAGNFDFDAYKAERIYPRWSLRLSVTKASAGAGKICGWVVVFREQNT